jgi:hypothetical protein
MIKGVQTRTVVHPRPTDELHEPWGPFELLRDAGEVELGPWLKASRYIAMHATKSSSHLVYSIGGRADRALHRRLDDRQDGLSRLRNPHLLQYQVIGRCERRGCLIATPYTGDHSGILTLGRLALLKGGLRGVELKRAVSHLLEGLQALHGAGFADGGLKLERLLVDRHGSVVIELAGLPLVMAGETASQEEFTADIVAAGRIAYVLAHGKPVTPFTLQELDLHAVTSWDSWLARMMRGQIKDAPTAVAELPDLIQLSPSIVDHVVQWAKDGKRRASRIISGASNLSDRTDPGVRVDPLPER